MKSNILTFLCLMILLMSGCSGCNTATTTTPVDLSSNESVTTDPIVGTWNIEYDGDKKDQYWNNDYSSLELTEDGSVYDGKTNLLGKYKESDGYIKFYESPSSDLDTIVKYEIDGETLKITDLRESNIDSQSENSSAYSALVGNWESGNDSLQFSETGWLYINGSKDNNCIFKAENDHLAEYQIVDGTIQDASLMKYEVSDTELKIVDFFENDDSSKWTTYTKVEATLTEEEALAVAEDLVEKYGYFMFNWVLCDLDWNDVVDWHVLAEMGYDFDGAVRITCCNSINEAEAHIRRYIGDDIVEKNDFYKNFLIVMDGKLYLGYGGKGGVTYGNVELVSFDDNSIVCLADEFVIGDISNGIYQFDIEKIDENYKLINVSEYQATLDSAQKEKCMQVALTWSQQDTIIDLGFNIVPDDGQGTVTKNNAVFKDDGTLLAVLEEEDLKQVLYIVDENAHYTLTIENPLYMSQGNIIGGEGAHVTITKGGTVLYDQEPSLVRSYTGYWFYGICEIQDGVVGDYDTSWIAETSGN